MELEEPETGHTRMIDYNSKFKMKKKRSQKIQVLPSKTT